MSFIHPIILAANEFGEDEVTKYTCQLARKRVVGALEATGLFVEIKELQTAGPSANAELWIGESIAIHLLAYEQHRVAYATCPDLDETLVLLTAFHERERKEGLARAERIARRFFDIDSS